MDEREQYERVCRDRFSSIDEGLKRVQTVLDRIDIAIRGNGDPGLNTRVHDLEQAQAAMQDLEKERRRSLSGRQTAIIAGITGAVVAGLVTLAQTLFLGD